MTQIYPRSLRSRVRRCPPRYVPASLLAGVSRSPGSHILPGAWFAPNWCRHTPSCVGYTWERGVSTRRVYSSPNITKPRYTCFVAVWGLPRRPPEQRNKHPRHAGPSRMGPLMTGYRGRRPARRPSPGRQRCAETPADQESAIASRTQGGTIRRASRVLRRRRLVRSADLVRRAAPCPPAWGVHGLRLATPVAMKGLVTSA